MGTVKLGVTLLMLAVLLALGSCGIDGSRQVGGRLTPGTPALQTSLPALPATDARAQHDPVLRLASGVLLLELPGDAYSAKSDNATADPVTHQLQLEAGSGELSWGLYGFGGLGQTDVPELLTIELGQDVPQIAWVALSDYSAGCWRWFSCIPENGEVRLNISDGRRMVNAAGTCYAAVAVWDNEQATLALLQLACRRANPLGVWPMAGYDAQHSGRSPYAGPDRPELKWSLNIGGIHQGLAISNDGVIYSGSTNGVLTAIDAQGAVLWRYTFMGFTVATPALGEDGTIYFSSSDHFLYAVNPAGELRWKYDMGRPVFSSPVIGDEGNVYLSGLAGLYCIVPDGEPAWIFNVLDGSRHTPAIAPDGTVYFTSFDTGLYAVNPEGSQQWQCTDVLNPTSSVSIGPDAAVYCASVQSAPPPDGARSPAALTYAVSPQGAVMQTVALGFEDGAPSFAADGTLYLLTSSMLYALNPDGTTKWTYSGGETGGQSVAVDGNGTVYFGARGMGSIPDNVTALNPHGTLKWRWESPAPIPSGPVVIGRNNMLYVGTESGYLLAIGEQ